MKFKTKLIALVLIMIVAVCLVLCACDNDTGLIRRNQERVSKQITADASYGGRVSAVTLTELYAAFTNYYSTILTYYSYGYISADTFQNYVDDIDEIFGNYNETLAKDALYDLVCIEYLSKHFETTCLDAAKVKAMKDRSTVGITYDFSNTEALAKYYKERYEEVKAILACYDDYYYVNKAIYTANKAVKELYDKYYDEVKSEYEAYEKTDEGDSVPAGYIGIDLVSEPYRLVYEKDDSALNTNGLVVKALYKDADPVVIPTDALIISGFDASSTSSSQEITVTYGKYSKSFDISIVEALPSRSTETEEETDDEKIAALTKNNTEVLGYFSFSVLESSYIKEGQTDAEYREALREYKIANTAMNRVLKYFSDNYRSFNYYLYNGFNSQLTDLVSKIVNADTVVTKAELEAKYNEMVAKEVEGYLSTPYTKDSINDSTIVHKYDTESGAAVKNDKGKYQGYYYVTQILIPLDNATLGKVLEFENEKTSTEDGLKAYMTTLLPEITAYTYDPDYDPEATCTEENCVCPRCANYKGNASCVFDTIEKWYGLEAVDGDPCVNAHTGDKVCPCVACPTHKYAEKVNVQEFIQQLSADLDACATIEEKVEKFNEYVQLINIDSGVFSNINDGKQGYLMTPYGVSSGMIAAFEDKSIELATQGIGAYGYTFGEYKDDTYGIHFIMVTDYVVDEANGDVNVCELDNKYCCLGLNYVTNPFATLEDDENPVIADGAALTPVKVGTIGYYLWKDLYDDSVSNATAAFKKAKIKDAGGSYELHPKAYKSTVKDLQDSVSK